MVSMQGSRSQSTPRLLDVVEVPAGPMGIDALWDPLADALSGGAPIAPIPQVSPLTPAAVVDSMINAIRAAVPVPSTTAVVLSTSGSTGHPRGVCLSASALTSLTGSVNALAGADPTWVLAIPPTSIGGLNVVIRAWATGRRPIPVASIGGADRFTDEGFADAVAVAKATGHPVAVSLVPTQLPRLLESDRGRRALADCSLVLVGGAALTPQAARDCTNAGIAITTTYGMTETSGGCVLDGTPLPGVQVHLDERDGRIFLAGPMLADGYRDGSNEVFVDGWLRTQDRGHWIDGRLHVLGRLDDVVIVNGVNVDLVAIEDRAGDHPRIESALAVAVDHAGSAEIHLIYRGDPIDLPTLRDWIGQLLGSAAAPMACTRVDAFAMTASGKIDRRATAISLGLELLEDDW